MNRKPLFVLAGTCVLFVATADETAKPKLNRDVVAPEKIPAKFLNSTPTPSDFPTPSPKRFFASKKLHEMVTKKGGPSSEADMKNYTDLIPRSKDAPLKMVAIKGGEFLFGSPESEDKRTDDEGPQKKVKIEPFWMGETEVTWALYTAYYQNDMIRRKDGTLRAAGEKHVVTLKGKNRDKALADELKRGDLNNIIDVVSQPTPQYMDMFFSGFFNNEMKYPAMCVTQHAASKFCQWLTAQTGHFYRLPTEAEWEYACRAGTTTAFGHGDDIKGLDDYAWHGFNADATYHPVGTKKPNAWGLYDMHGNVAEWVLDGYSEDYRNSLKDGLTNPWNIALTRYPRVTKGGSWDSDQDQCRSAARLASEKAWKDLDPQVPKSIWYHSDGQHVGFRVVRPLKTPSAEEMHLYWNTDWWDSKRNAEDL